MPSSTPKRIAIIGLPGSGKSTFATKLGALLNLPVHHLDKHQFDGKQKRDKKEFLETKEALIQEEAWIIEGCALSSLEMRFARAETVIYFQLPRLLCMWRLCKRVFMWDESDASTGCLKGLNCEILRYTWNFHRDKTAEIFKLHQRYPNVEFLVFSHSTHPERYLKKLKQAFEDIDDHAQFFP